jgi:hypothetical protein
VSSTAWIQTFSGRKFYPLDPDPANIDVRDIAHALSNQCRFSGHTTRFYSVAEHSVLVSRVLQRRGAASEAVLWGLLHDATEAYLVDMPRPLKHDPEFGAAYRRFEHVLNLAVAERFGLPEYVPDSVHQADNDLLLTEKRDLLGPSPDLWYVGPGEPVEHLSLQFGPTPRGAELLFLRRYTELTGEVIEQ